VTARGKRPASRIERDGCREPLGVPPFCLLCLAISLTLPVALGRAQARENTGQAAARVAPERGAVVHVSDGLLSVRAQDASLGELLEEVASQTGMTLEGHGSIANRITIQFDQLPVEEGLLMLLRGQSYLLVSREKGGDAPTALVPEVLRMFRGRDSPGKLPRVAERRSRRASSAAAPEISRLLDVLERSEDTWDKEDAINALVRAGDAGVAQPLGRFALTDEDKAVRVAGIQALVKLGGTEAAQALAIALGDEDEAIRRRAVNALGQVGGEDAVVFLDHVWRRDRDLSVRDAAAAALAQLGEPIR